MANDFFPIQQARGQQKIKTFGSIDKNAPIDIGAEIIGKPIAQLTIENPKGKGAGSVDIKFINPDKPEEVVTLRLNITPDGNFVFPGGLKAFQGNPQKIIKAFFSPEGESTNDALKFLKKAGVKISFSAEPSTEYGNIVKIKSLKIEADNKDIQLEVIGDLKAKKYSLDNVKISFKEFEKIRGLDNRKEINEALKKLLDSGAKFEIDQGNIDKFKEHVASIMDYIIDGNTITSEEQRENKILWAKVLIEIGKGIKFYYNDPITRDQEKVDGAAKFIEKMNKRLEEIKRLPIKQ